MNRGVSAIALAAIVVVVAALVWLLVSGGPNPSTEDPNDDVVVSAGRKPPADPSLAEVIDASARVERQRVVFEAVAASDVPESLDDGAAEWRWEVIEDEQVTWIVTVSVDLEQHASLLATQFDNSTSTIARTLPGELEIEADTVTVALELDRLSRFPEQFNWVLESSLDGDRALTGSAEAHDRVPDAGSLEAQTN